MVIKCKLRSQVEVDEVSEQAYQTDDPSPSRVVVDTNISFNLCSLSGEVDIIELARQYSMSQSDKKGDSIEDEDEEKDEEFDDDVETKSDDHSPQLSY